MGLTQSAKTALFLLVLVYLSFPNLCYGARKLTALYQPPAMLVSYHKGALLEGDIPVSILWYGKFTPAQKSIVADFLLSLTQNDHHQVGLSSKTPRVSQWWETIQTYVEKAGKKGTQVILSGQVTDEGYSMGKSLKRSQISELAAKANSKAGGIALVLTADDVAVEGFCMSNCGFHGSDSGKKSTFIWVGNSVTQCPGQCAWPFHQPIYGPQTTPLGAPNGDVGLDGMIVNIASLLAGTVTNPFGKGFYEGQADAPLEAASACTGIYGKGAYPGYAGELLVDSTSGASYNAQGANSRKYLLPALYDPKTSSCSTLV
ncbi:protein PHOSPHATE-INDUCED 1-like [Telopea speciosissima]|uniref:protein PHOSPHATE-INDUCED 1-like n=1 Tax=Telopea speciosissima TaxID=54955 RepID=UPI001CC479EF|nr:protein PHOSPHATE-INDUCED 1-like [Telopea speciosissima]